MDTEVVEQLVKVIFASPLLTTIYIFVMLEGTGIEYIIEICYISDRIRERIEKVPRAVRNRVKYLFGVGWGSIWVYTLYVCKYGEVIIDKDSVENVLYTAFALSSIVLVLIIVCILLFKK